VTYHAKRISRPPRILEWCQDLKRRLLAGVRRFDRIRSVPLYRVKRAKLHIGGHADMVVFQLARATPEVWLAPARHIYTVVLKILRFDGLGASCAAEG
jgi:hypothetical protein